MNHFQADVSGTVEQILVDDGKPVSVDLVNLLPKTVAHLVTQTETLIFVSSLQPLFVIVP